MPESITSNWLSYGPPMNLGACLSWEYDLGSFVQFHQRNPRILCKVPLVRLVIMHSRSLIIREGRVTTTSSGCCKIDQVTGPHGALVVFIHQCQVSQAGDGYRRLAWPIVSVHSGLMNRGQDDLRPRFQQLPNLQFGIDEQTRSLCDPSPRIYGALLTLHSLKLLRLFSEDLSVTKRVLCEDYAPSMGAVLPCTLQGARKRSRPRVMLPSSVASHLHCQLRPCRLQILLPERGSCRPAQPAVLRSTVGVDPGKVP